MAPFGPELQGHGRVALTNLFSAAIIPALRNACPSRKNCRIRFYASQEATYYCKLAFNDPHCKNYAEIPLVSFFYLANRKMITERDEENKNGLKPHSNGEFLLS